MEAIDVPSALQERLGTAGTAGLLELFESARQEWTADVTIAAVERFERRLAEEGANWRVVQAQSEAALRLEISALRGEMREGFAALRLEIREGRFELLKWCFVFWVGQVFAVAGVLAVVLRMMLA